MKLTQPLDEQMPIGEAAKALGVSVETVRRWDRMGQIRSMRTPGGQRRFARSEIDRIRTPDSSEE